MVNALSKVGYVVLRDAISAKVMISALNQLADLYAPKNVSVSAEEPKTLGEAHNRAFQAYLQQGLICPELRARKYDVSASLPAVASILKDLEQDLRSLVGAPYIITKCQFRFDDFTGSRSLGLHQEVFGMMSDSTVTTWLPLCETNRALGGLTVVPKSDRLGIIPHVMQENANGFVAHGVDMSSFGDEMKKESIVLTTSPGDAVMFNPYLIHGTSVPETDQANRITFICRADPIDRIRSLHDIGASKTFVTQA
jgi:ectoine hydroxylase-related dioxygenase (phytanoyl-CoA dioxygenase family)